MADGTITFSTALDNSQLEKDLKQAEREVDGLKKKVEKSEASENAVKRQLDEAREAAEAADEQVERLRQRLAELSEAGPVHTADEYRAVRDEIESVNAQLDEAVEKSVEQGEAVDKLREKLEEATRETANQKAELEKARAKAAELGDEYARSYSRGAGASSAALAQAEAQFERFGKRIKTMAKKVFVFGTVLAGLRAVKSALSDALAENERYTASWANLKAVLQGIARFIAGTMAPVLTGFVNSVAAMVETLARMVDSVFGTAIQQAIEQAKAAAQAAAATDKQAKSTKNLAKATKEATKQVMAFDEINAMSADDADGVADALDPGSEGQADWGAFDVGKIDAKLAEIMAVLGGALMAVGAVLAFSGVNIPLGIALMAVGALMVYTAYKEQWDALPAEVRGAISNMLMVTGMVLFLLGVVLAFAGPSTMAVGIGMMAAGAVLIWTSVALNWDSMPDEVKGVVSLLLGVLGGALLVIGAILCLSGGGTPLGIGLMALGAADLAGVAALNWDSLPDDVKDTVTYIEVILGGALLALGAILALSGWATFLGIGLMAVGAVGLAAAAVENWDYINDHVDEVVSAIHLAVSAALLVIGAVLAFSGANVVLGIGLLAVGAIGLVSWVVLNWDDVKDQVEDALRVLSLAVGAAMLALGAILCLSGAAVPLGITLLLAGAVLLVSAAALNWNELPGEVQGVVTAIMAILGGALLVLGIILCVTGVGIPVGIALILAGAAMLAGAAFVNWGFLQQQIAQVWAGIVSWWNSTVAPVFTWQFWRDLFVSMVNGLIYCINSAINDFCWFVNSIASGISWVLSVFDVNWSGSISMPNIPYLAQGAVIPPNREFMAVLGDQRHGNNIEAPESLIRQIVAEESGRQTAALIQALSSAQGQSDVTLVLRVGNEDIARATAKGSASLARRGLLDAQMTFA